MKTFGDKDYLRMAYKYASENSDDTSTQTGAVIAVPGGMPLGYGANRFPTGVKVRAERLERPNKLAFIEHAERDAVLRYGFPLFGHTLYAPWSSCSDCARAIILSGISELVGHQEIFDKTPRRWMESIAQANAMLDEAGVKRRLVSDKIGGVRILFDGQLWEP